VWGSHTRVTCFATLERKYTFSCQQQAENACTCVLTILQVAHCRRKMHYRTALMIPMHGTASDWLLHGYLSTSHTNTLLRHQHCKCCRMQVSACEDSSTSVVSKTSELRASAHIQPLGWSFVLDFKRFESTRAREALAVSSCASCCT